MWDKHPHSSFLLQHLLMPSFQRRLQILLLRSCSLLYSSHTLTRIFMYSCGSPVKLVDLGRGGGLEIRQHPAVFKTEEVSWGCKRELWEHTVGVPKCQFSSSHCCCVLTLKWLAQDFSDRVPRFQPLHLATEVSMDLKAVSAWIQGCVCWSSGYLGRSQRPEARAGLKPKPTLSWFLILNVWLLRKKEMWFHMFLRLKGKICSIYCPSVQKSLPCSFQAISYSFFFLAHVIEGTMNPFFFLTPLWGLYVTSSNPKGLTAHPAKQDIQNWPPDSQAVWLYCPSCSYCFNRFPQPVSP